MRTVPLDPNALCLDLECIIPECDRDDACDPLEESCLSYRCAPALAEHLFLFNPNGEVYDSVHVAGDFNANSEEYVRKHDAGG